MIGLCDGPAIVHLGADEETWMGTITAGNNIVWVYMLEGSTAITWARERIHQTKGTKSPKVYFRLILF